MKKRIFISLLCVFLAITLISVFASCDAKSDAMNESAMGGAPEPGEDIKLELDGSQIDSESGEYERKIIKTADISSETKNFDKALEKVDELCKQYNAYIESSTIGGVSYGSEVAHAMRALLSACLLKNSTLLTRTLTVFST